MIITQLTALNDKILEAQGLDDTIYCHCSARNLDAFHSALDSYNVIGCWSRGRNRKFLLFDHVTVYWPMRSKIRPMAYKRCYQVFPISPRGFWRPLPYKILGKCGFFFSIIRGVCAWRRVTESWCIPCSGITINNAPGANFLPNHF